jgi:hypothetical protein
LIGLPGLCYHANALKKIIEESYRDIYDYFGEENIQIDIIIAEWVFSLFSSAIPLESQINFYFGFFGEGWEFFYKLCISVILSIYNKRESYNDVADVYVAFKLGKHFETSLSESKRIWNDFIDKAYKLEI